MLNGLQALAHHAPSGSPEAAVSLAPAVPVPHVDDILEFVSVSASLRRLLAQAELTGSRLQLANIEGEAGTGKHLFAQTIHRRSALISMPFRRRDSREWLASDVDSADPSQLTGTLYLDRVDLLAAAGQGLLLNFIKMLPELSSTSRPQRFLLLASSQTSLRQLAAQGTFIPDLAFRLAAVRFTMPPLRDHREDIAPITQVVIDRICRRYQQPTAVLAPGTLPRLLQHTWPGNVRELASVLESAILESTTGIIRPAHLTLSLPSPLETASQSNPTPSQAAALPTNLSLDTVIHRHIQLVLDLNRGNKLRAARQLGISRSTLYRILAGGTTLPS